MELNKKTMQRIMLLITFAVLLFWGLYNISAVTKVLGKLLDLLSPLLLGICIAFVLNLMMAALERLWDRALAKWDSRWNRKMKRPVCLALTMVLFIGIIFAIFFILLPRLEEAAKRIGIGRATYFRWLKGESTHLKANTLKKLSDMLDCDVKSILDEEDRIKPIVGSVKAGYDGFPMEDIEGYIELNRHDGKKGDYFLRVRGDSMINAHIYEGDLVFVKQTNEVESGSIAIVLVGEEATLKRVLYKKGLMILEAANPKIDTKVFTPEEVEELPVKVIGKVLYARRDFD